MRCLALLALMMIAGESRADNAVLKPGDAAPAWVNLPGVDGKTHSLADLADKDVVVVVFTCCSCPAAQDYETRIAAFAQKHAGPKVALVAINVNTGPEDRMPQMKDRAAEGKFTYPFLCDETQKIAKLYGAEYTPEFFVLNKERKVVYMGAFDDRDNPKLATKQFVDEAVVAALAGRMPAVTETLARGCRIPFVRAKRK